MTTVGIHGINGKLGTMIRKHLEKSHSDFKIFEVSATSIPQYDVIIDVTSPKGLESILSHLTGQRLIVGTTGDIPITLLKTYAKNASVFVVPNFSIGMREQYTLIKDFLNSTQEKWEECIITDIHHKNKIDAPSGTAKHLAELIKSSGIAVKIKSIREGEEVGTHKVTFHNKYESTTITHKAISREAYANGCTQLINSIMSSQNGYYEI